MIEKKSGNFADLDYSGIHQTDTGFKFEIYQFRSAWYYADYNGDPVGPFLTSADAYYDAQGF